MGGRGVGLKEHGVLRKGGRLLADIARTRPNEAFIVAVWRVRAVR